MSSLKGSESTGGAEHGGNGERGGEQMLVGLGASAGGLEPLKQFFEMMPPDTGLAFVVIIHLSPEHASSLAELLQNRTRMPVRQVTEPVRVEPNRVYVIPPDKNLVMMDGHIALTGREGEAAKQVPVDLFFRTLAETYKHRAFAAVLSGAGTDGSVGVRSVKEAGGVCIAQDPREAEYEGMPRSAIESGAVDFVLPVADIPGKIVSLKRNAESIQLPAPEEGARNDLHEGELRELLALLRARTRHDFSSYKRATLLRRVERRLQVTESPDIAAYLGHVRRHPEELQGLLRDLLISVTNFFRDPETFGVMASQVMPRLLNSKGPGDQVRVWVPGCATGEEAFSLAMLLAEQSDLRAHAPAVQVFATDIDERAIATARASVYPDTIAADVSPERLKRFFMREGEYYRVRREIREMVLFAPHNVLRDPPFSKLDLVSCRNLLIYLNRQIQDRVLEIFNFALRADGYLLLGSSETADGVPALFAPTSKKHRIYQRVRAPGAQMFAPALPVTGHRAAQARPHAPLTPLPDNFTFGELHFRLLEAYAPPSVLVTADYEIVHLSEHAGRYLRFAGGEPTRNLLRSVHPDLRLELRTLLLGAAQAGEPRAGSAAVKFDGGGEHVVTLDVRPVSPPHSTPGFMLVLFKEAEEPAPRRAAEVVAAARAAPASQIEEAIHRFESELERTREQLRATVEEYETSTEELKASNEELQAMNEEMRSASEELETSKEEVQSLNEELTTVNNELKEKIEEVTLVNSDLINLMASIEIGTLFLDRHLRLTRYTPRVKEFFNIIPGDAGRPLAHITHRLGYDGLTEDAESVLRDPRTIEREVPAPDGRWLLARLAPYRTAEDKINGVVITFVDITDHRSAERKLRESEERLRLVVETAEDYAIIITDPEGRVVSWNKGAERMFGYSEPEMRGRPAALIFTPEDRAAGVPEREMRTADERGSASDERWHLRKDGTLFYVSGVMAALRDGHTNGYAKIARDLTSQKRVQDELQRAWEELDQRVQERTSELAEANAALREEVGERLSVERERARLLRQIVSTQEDERRRISRELHDQLGQWLTALRLKLEHLMARCDGEEELCAQVAQLQDIARRLDADVDFLAWELRPTALDDLGLVPALDNYAQEWSKHFNIPVEFRAAGLGDERLDPATETNLYRVAQEALNNVAKHAGASAVSVLIERRDDEAVLIVEDDGRGFDAERSARLTGGRGMGLAGMRERAALVGGMVEVESAEGGGTTVFARVPITPPGK
jgi:two-component system, chemotaxis family, CheB/CheR fusion protein